MRNAKTPINPMKIKIAKLATLVACSLAVQAVPAQVYPYIGGFFDRQFTAGNNLFVNPFENSPDNLTNLFSGVVPNGTTISLWDPTVSAFGTTSEYLNGAWTLNLTLLPGTGSQLYAPSAFDNSFNGYVLNHDGTYLTTQLNFTPPSVFAGPNETYLLGDMSPVVDTGSDIFLNILGRLPNVGEQVRTLSGTSTYLGNGNWDNVPTLGEGDAAFLTVGSVPEPSAVSVFSLCGLFIWWRMRRHNLKSEPQTTIGAGRSARAV
jgi:hypothetical protein